MLSFIFSRLKVSIVPSTNISVSAKIMDKQGWRLSLGVDRAQHIAT